MADKDHTVSVVGYPGAIKIYVDGQEIEGITKLTILHEPKKAAEVVITLVPDKLEVLNLTSNLVAVPEKNVG